MIIKSVKGGEEIEVIGHCVLSLMDQKKQTRFMAGVTDSEWVKAIADEYRYTGQLAHIEETTERRDRITSYNVCYTKLLRTPSKIVPTP